MKELYKEFFSVKKLRWRVAIILSVCVIYSLFNTRITLWISTIVSNAGNRDMVAKYVNLLIIGLISNTVLRYVKDRLFRTMYDISYTTMANKLTDKILDADYDLFTKYGTGRLTTIIGSIGQIAGGGRVILDIVFNIIQFVIITTAICSINAKLLLPIIVVYSIGAVAFYKIYKKAIYYDRLKDDVVHARNDEVNKMILGFAELRSTCSQEYHRNKVKNMNQVCFDACVAKTKIVAIESMSFELLDSIITLVAVLYSVVMIPTGNLLSSLAMSLVIYAWRLLDPMISAIVAMDEMSVCVSMFEKYDEFMKIDTKVKDGTIELKEFQSSIKFQNVSFRYDQSDLVLSDISFKVKKGEKIGICGYSGGGKSTLLKLIPRFYDVTGGEILIDGINIKDLTLNSLRNKIGVVHQDNYIFDGTIEENITYGVGSVGYMYIFEACKKACIYDFIMNLPEGLKTNVGSNGLKLSGGQKQRIALARIFLRNPDIIILDEATSSLDNECENIIQDSLDMFSDKTIITVAHRLSTIKESDRIIVINEHKIEESGTHDELMVIGGIYKELYTAKDE